MALKNVLSNLVCFSVLAIPSTLLASPMISADTADYSAGALYLFDTKQVEHTFIIKNTGDSALVIKQVKGSCGCTTVGFDTTIAPGKTGKVTQSVNVHNMNTGEFRKNITVFSNAKNNPEFRLSVGGILKSYIDLSKQEIRLHTQDQKQWSDTVTLTTTKQDLSITEVTFKSYDNSAQNTPAWQSDLRIYPVFSLKKITGSDTKNSNYKLIISFASKNSETQYGEFTIKTNHPKMSEIKIGGSIEGKN